MMKTNVSSEDIYEIETSIGIQLTKEQRECVLKEYNRVCTDMAEDWYVIVKELIKKYFLIKV